MGRTLLRLFSSLPLFALAACGSVKDAGPDASTVDADISGTATVETESVAFGVAAGTNVGNIDIISMLPNNTVLEAIKTDAGGNATIKVYPGGSVTAVYKHTADMGADLITYVGVKPNDTLIFGSRNPSAVGVTQTNLGAQTYQWVVQAGVTNHCAFTSCSGACAGVGTSVAVTEFNTCNRSPMDILYIALGANGLVSHYNFRANVAFTAGQTLPAVGWAAAQNATVNITGIPAEVSNVSGNWATVLDGATEYNYAQSYNGAPTGGAFTSTFAFHPTGDRSLGRLNMSRPGSFQTIQVIDQFNTSTLNQTVATPTLTPWIQGGLLVSSALRIASWFLVSDANSVSDGVVVRLNWSHVVSSVSHPHQWHIIMPPGQQSLALPKLPAAFNENLPAPQDFIGGQVRVFDISTLNGYDAVRATPSRNIMCIECALRGGDLQRATFSGFVN